MSVADLAANTEWLRTPYIKPEEEKEEPPRRAIGKNEDVPHRDWLDYDFIGPVCENCGVRTYKVRSEDVFACPICFHHRGAFAAPEEEEDRDPFNTGMHDEYDLDESGHIKAIHTCENAPEEEKHPGVIAKPGNDGEIEWCWCQKCYAHAAVVHNPFGDGENWSYCKTCGVSFRLKRGEGEK